MESRFYLKVNTKRLIDFARPGGYEGRNGQAMTDTMKIMIRLIRAYWWYEEGHLEAMTEDEVRDIYNRLIDWIG